MILIDFVVIILPCINLLKWGVYYTEFTLEKTNKCWEKVLFLQTIDGFYALCIRASTVN
jgi:hypothetical protein